MTEKIILFFNSNFFIALVTLIVGGLAIYLYLKQKTDKKRDAASLILQEIRYAEQQIRNARSMGANYYFANKLLPTNNWDNNIHLFVNDLDEIEIDLISQFYSQATYLDCVINKISDHENRLKIIRAKDRQGNLINIKIDEKSPIKLPEYTLNANEVLKDVSQKIEFLYNTPVGNKLKDISKKKWYQIL